MSSQLNAIHEADLNQTDDDTLIQILGRTLSAMAFRTGGELNVVWLSFLEKFRLPHLENIENAIYVIRCRRMAQKLAAAGFKAIYDGLPYSERMMHCILVSLENENDSEWATPDECQRLLDSAQNLSLQESWRRWVWKTSPKGAAGQGAMNMGDTLEWCRAATDVPVSEKIQAQADTKALIKAREALKQDFLNLANKPYEYLKWNEKFAILSPLMSKYKLGRDVAKDAAQRASQQYWQNL